MRERSGRQDVPERSGPKGWRGVLAQRTPPMRAAAKRRSQAGVGGTVGPRRGVYGALAGRLTAEPPRGLEAILGEQAGTPYNRDGLKFAPKVRH